MELKCNNLMLISTLYELHMHDESIEEAQASIYIYTCTSIQFYYWVKLYSYVDIYMPGLYFNTFQVHVSVFRILGILDQ